MIAMPNTRGHAQRVSEGTISGGGMSQVWRVFEEENVKPEAVADSHLSDHHLGFAQCDYHHFGIWVRATSQLMIPDLSVQVLQSWDDKQENYVVPETGGVIMAINDDVPHIDRLNITPMRFLRFRLVGEAANPRDTKVDLYLFMQA